MKAKKTSTTAKSTKTAAAKPAPGKAAGKTAKKKPSTSHQVSAKNFSVREETLNGWPVRITTYTIDGTSHCHIDNASPGAIFARASGKNRDDVERNALESASARLAQTRRVKLPPSP